jgi:hypothetical protein
MYLAADEAPAEREEGLSRRRCGGRAGSGCDCINIMSASVNVKGHIRVFLTEVPHDQLDLRNLLIRLSPVGEVVIVIIAQRQQQISFHLLRDTPNAGCRAFSTLNPPISQNACKQVGRRGGSASAQETQPALRNHAHRSERWGRI